MSTAVYMLSFPKAYPRSLFFSLCICVLCIYSEEGDRKNMRALCSTVPAWLWTHDPPCQLGLETCLTTLLTPAYLHLPKYANWMDFCLVCTVQKNLNRRSPANARSPFSVYRLLSLTHTFSCVGSDEIDYDLYFCGLLKHDSHTVTKTTRKQLLISKLVRTQLIKKKNRQNKIIPTIYVRGSLCGT